MSSPSPGKLKTFVDDLKIGIHMRLNDLAAYRQRKIDKWEKAGKPVPPPHTIKKYTIDEYRERFKYRVFVETGTYWGAMIWYQRNKFDHLYSIELDEGLWRRAVSRFHRFGHIKILQGDSGKVLPPLLSEIREPVIFWLDGHYSGGYTAKGDKECPIYEEINAILKYKEHRHIILIDDAREFNGLHDYPDVAEISAYIRNNYPGYSVVIANDVIQCFPV